MSDPFLWSQFDGHPLRVDPEADMGYIRVREGGFKRNDLADEPRGIIADYDAHGRLLGIEIFLRDGEVRPESAEVIRRLLGAEK